MTKIAVPLDVQLRLAEINKRLAIVRYKIGVRQGAAWLNPNRKRTSIVVVPVEPIVGGRLTNDL